MSIEEVSKEYKHEKEVEYMTNACRRLRNKTGAGIMDCKKALLEAEKDE